MIGSSRAVRSRAARSRIATTRVVLEAVGDRTSANLQDRSIIARTMSIIATFRRWNIAPQSRSSPYAIHMARQTAMAENCPGRFQSMPAG
jgi:hypothetical protein